MKQTLKEKSERKLKEMKALKEHLNTQLHLGTAETKEAFENQKKNLSKWIDSAKDKLINVKEISEEKALKINKSLEALRAQATIGLAKTDEALIEQQKNISIGIKHLQNEVVAAYDTSKDKIEDFAEEADDKLSDFYTRFDLFRLQFHLGKEESKDVWEQKKKIISKELHTIEMKIDKGIAEATEKLDYFSDEIKDSWKRLINVFKS